ncbi:MAG: hypothetical protein GTO63_30275 [Anaerolineae bacterium]|nr:hypothetical protein [Anaerolineae bacterium]NIN98992.1 hypothetical protein [Anaerolineae bacterium]
MPPPISLGTLTILSGQANSEALDFRAATRAQNIKALTIYAPGTLPEGIHVEVRPPGGAWRRLQSGGADVAVTVGDATVLDTVTYSELRVSTDTGTVAADRVFDLEGREESRW